MRRVRVVLVAATVLLALPLCAQAQTPALVPEQVRVTLAPDGLVIHFGLADVATATIAGPQVLYRVDGGEQKAADAVLVGTVLPVLNTDAFATQVWAATLEVPPGARVAYQVRDALRGDSAPFEVRRPDGGALRFVAMGDIGYDGVAADGSGDPALAPPIAMRDLALAQDPDLLVIPGDLAYLNSRAGWDRFFRMHSPLQAAVPVVPAVGNHEWEDGFGYGQYLASYVLPGGEEDYVQRAGPVTFVVVNSDAACIDVRHRSNGPLHQPCPNGLDEGRTQWLRDALSSAAADEAPWTVVVMHHPPYSWGDHGSDWVTHVYWTPLFEELGVDLVLTAHDHLYGRTHQVRQREVVDGQTPYVKGVAPVYAVVGGGGRELYDLPPGAPPAWLAHGEKVHHLAVIEADEDALTYEAKRVDGSTMDAFTIAKPAGTTASPASTPDAGLAVAVLVIALALAWKRR